VRRDTDHTDCAGHEKQADYADIMHMDRPHSHHIPMDRQNRAKIFMPFAALRGYEEAIAQIQKEASAD